MAETPIPDSGDVKRILGLQTVTSFQQEQIDGALEAAKSWAKKYLRYDYENVGEEPTTETFFEVVEDGSVPTPVEGAAIESITVFFSPGDSGTVLDEDNWEYDSEMIRLRPPSTRLVAGFESAFARRTFRTYTKIVVEYDASDVDVPAAIRDGVALAAAAFWLRAPKLAKGLTSENIGDYSYSLAQQSGQNPMFHEAKALLRSFRRAPQLI